VNAADALTYLDPQRFPQYSSADLSRGTGFGISFSKPAQTGTPSKVLASNGTFIDGIPDLPELIDETSRHSDDNTVRLVPIDFGWKTRASAPAVRPGDENTVMMVPIELRRKHQSAAQTMPPEFENIGSRNNGKPLSGYAAGTAEPREFDTDQNPAYRTQTTTAQQLPSHLDSSVATGEPSEFGSIGTSAGSTQTTTAQILPLHLEKPSKDPPAPKKRSHNHRKSR